MEGVEIRSNILVTLSIISICFATILVVSCGETPYTDSNGFLIYEHTQSPCEGADGEPIDLINNIEASDPTWAQLESFLSNDNSDSSTHRSSYRCGDLAETVHNNAEAAGIKAAFVIVIYKHAKTLHALNAFQTTDNGLVFIDCNAQATQRGISDTLPVGKELLVIPDSYDKVAYIKIRCRYGLISLTSAAYYGLQYSGYIRWLTGMDNFCSDLYNYNLEFDRQSDDWMALSEEYNKLESEAKQLGAFWQTMPKVTSVTIYW